VRLGLIGAGRWGRNYIRTIGEIGGVTMTRLASRNPARQELVGTNCTISSDWREVATARDLDGVIIATPPHLHVEMTRAAVEAGLAVLVEKPLALSTTEARALLVQVEQAKSLVMVDHVMTYSPAFAKLGEIAEGQGAIHHIESQSGNWGPFRDDVSALWDWAAHDVALCLSLLKESPSKVRATRTESRHTADGFGESYSLHLAFPGGAVADIEVSSLWPEKTRRFSATFDGQALIFDDTAPNKLTRYAAGADINGKGGPVAIDPKLALNCAVEAFAATITHGDRSLASLRLGVDVVDVLVRCEASLEMGGAQ
jgi:predicted dehydrogenase